MRRFSDLRRGGSLIKSPRPEPDGIMFSSVLGSRGIIHRGSDRYTNKKEKKSLIFLGKVV